MKGGPGRRLAIIAGRPSHGRGEHEFPAGARLIARSLAEDARIGDVTVTVHLDGRPGVEAAIDTADAVVVYADGGEGHPLLVGDRLERMRARIGVGTGLGLIHYAVDVPDEHGAELMAWVGGRYQAGVSCNPIWEARFEALPGHPITRGVGPFTARDEWYFNLLLAEEVTPILVATPADNVRAGPYVWPAGPYPHIVAAAGRPETLMWTLERADGGRGFGFCGGHFHRNWANRSFRSVVLNALVWATGATVPAGGVGSSPEL